MVHVTSRCQLDDRRETGRDCATRPILCGSGAANARRFAISITAPRNAMTLELGKISGQIDAMGRALAARAKQRTEVLPAVRALLRQYANSQAQLREVAESEAGQRVRCASPGVESLDEAFASPKMPERLTVIATDGSQIYPDTHAWAYYYAINIGSIIWRHGSRQAPEVSCHPTLRFSEEWVYPDGAPVSSDLVSAERDLSEIKIRAEMALAEQQAGSRVVALGDGSLLIWLRGAGVPEAQQTRILADYLGCLDQLRGSDVATAGFVSRPLSAEVVSLLYLAHLEPLERSATQTLADTAFRGVTDRALFGYLRPGERSALFVRGTAANRDFGARGHAVYFFYLNTGTEVARVEVPEWLAGDAEGLGLVHATVYDQCCLNQGYPYVLTRADEEAVILGEEREALEQRIIRAILEHGLPLPELSRKAQQKQVARWRRRRQ